MKKITLIISLLIVFGFRFGYSQGIEFETGTWEEVLHKAVETQKPIFVDVYTTWCGPCKIMNNKVFPLEEVGNMYNSNFICYKVDAEKGEGVKIAKEFEVRSYPTYLFLNTGGSLIMRTMGSMSPEKFLDLAISVKNELGNPKSLFDWEQEYAQKKSDTAFLKSYMEKRALLGKSNAELFDEYLSLLPDNQRISKEIVEIYQREMDNIKINSLAYKNLQDNKAKFFKLNQNIYSIMTYAIRSSLYEAIANKDEQLLKEIIEANEKLPKIAEPRRKEELYMDYYKGTNNMEKYILYATTYCETYLMTVSLDSIAKADEMKLRIFDGQKKLLETILEPAEIEVLRNSMAHILRDKYSGELNDIAWKFFEKVTDLESLNNALSWSKRSLDIYPNNFMYLDTYANLLYKLGQKKKAISMQTKALNIVKKTKNEEEITNYATTLQKMKSGEKTWE